MKNIKKLCSIALASAAIVFFLVLVSSTASASITEIRITTSGTAENPAIYSNNVVWQDFRNGNWDIYLYNLSTGGESRITNESNQHSPDTYDNWIVWTDERDISTIEGYEIYVFNLSTGDESKIANGDVADPAVYGSRILYMSSTADWHVEMYDISNREITVISDLLVVSSNPAIYNDKIVWSCRDTLGDANIYLRDLSTAKKIQISTSGKAFNPDIYGNKIVWQDDRNGNFDIYMYDLSTRKETRITRNKSDSENPVIYENSIVWQDNRNGNWDIYAYDLATRQQIHITEKSDQVMPAIYDNKLVWTDYRNGNPDIYMGTISYLPVAAFTAPHTSGKAPLTVKFIDRSKDAYYWFWNFGDKSTSTAQSPVHKYNKPGKYTVSLIVKNAAGSDTKTAYSMITVR